jgi:hypothetical protein
MEKNTEDKIREEIARRAFKKSAQKEKQLETQYTLEALQEMTGLTRDELASIEKDVRTHPPQDEDRFFSVKHQIIIATVIILIVALLYWL